MANIGGFGDAFVVGGEFNTAAPAPVSGQKVPLQVDSAGNLLVNAAIPGTPNVNVAEVGGAPVSLGAKPSATSIPVVLATDEAALPVSGTVTANQGAPNATPWNENLVQVGGSAVSLGAKASVSSIPVVLATDEAALNTIVTAATSSLSTITFNSGNPRFSALIIPCTGMGTVVVEIETTSGTFTGGAVFFYSSIGGHPFISITGMRSVGQGTNQQYDATSSQSLSSSQLISYWFNVSGFDAFLIELDQVIVGTGSATITAKATSMPVVGPTTVGQSDATKHNVTSALYTDSVTPVAPRTPNIFKTAQATASGNTAVWTPTTGKKFRLMRFKIDVTENANIAAGAVVTLKFQDGTTDIGIAQDAFLPTTQITTQIGDGFSSGWIDLGNGYLSSAANNVLNINLSTALSNGNVRVLVCGTEE